MKITKRVISIILAIFITMAWCPFMPVNEAMASSVFMDLYVSYDSDKVVNFLNVKNYLSGLLGAQLGPIMLFQGINANNIKTLEIEGSSAGITNHDIWWVRDTFRNLEKFKIKGSIQTDTIPNNAFHASSIGGGHKNLQYVNVYEEAGVKYIGDYAFNMCPKLYSVSIYEAEIIGKGAFANSGTQISQVEEHGKIINEKLDDLRFNSATDVLDNAFEGCIYLEEVSLNSMKNLGAHAFLNCTSLKKAIYPEAINIGAGAFQGCNSLTQVQLPKVTSISDYTFQQCDALQSIYLPSATYIGWGAFEQSDILQTINFPKVTHIKDYAFYNCTSLKDVTLPKVNRIDWNGFLNCTSITNISLPEATFIGIDAFKDCTSLESAYLPKIATLDRGAFYNCTSLDTLILGYDVPTVLNPNVFDHCPSSRKVHVPFFAKDTYDNADGVMDGKWRGWTIETLSNSAKIYSFSFNDFPQPIYGTFSGPFGHEIGVTVPYGTDITKLKPTIAISPGATLSPVSGVPTDFSTPRLRYTVTAKNPGFIGCYYVTVNVAKNTEKDIKSFRLNSPNVNGVIDQSKNEIHLTLPHATNVTNLAPIITVSNTASVSPLSGTVQDFSSPVTYTVTAEDGSTKAYIVHAHVQNNLPKFQAGVVANNNADIKLGESHNVDLTKIFEDEDNDPMTYRVSINSSPYQNTGSDYSYTPSDITPAVLRFIANDGYGDSTQVYEVTVTATKHTGKDIKTFVLNDISPSVNGTIDELKKEIELVLPHGTAKTEFAPTITLSEAASVSPLSGALQDFSSPVTYTVTAQDDSTKDYTVHAYVKNNLPKFQSGVVSSYNKDIKLGETHNVDLTKIFQDDDKDPLTYRVSINSAPYQNVGSNYLYTPSDTTPTVLRFIANDGYDDSTQVYEVTVTVTKRTGKDIKTFVLNDISPSVNGTIDELKKEIELILPHGTAKTEFAPTITLSEAASVSPLSGALQDFSSPITYTVTAQDDSTKAYIVYAHVANNLPKLRAGVVSSYNKDIKLGDIHSIDLSKVFKDDDNDAMTYKVSINNAPYQNAGSDYSYTPSDTTPTVLRFIANDGYGDSTQVYEVTVTAYIPVTGISFTNKIVTINKDVVGKLVDTLPYSIVPYNATNKYITWHSSNPHILSVDNGTGMLEAKGIGVSLVTVFSTDTTYGTISDTCTVYVVDNTTPPSGVKHGDILGTLVDLNGIPLAGYEVTLFSTPITVVTDANGRFRFPNVPYYNHTLVVNTPLGIEEGRIGMDFTQGSRVDFDTDMSQNINITFTQNTSSIEMILKNNSGINVENVNISVKIPDKVPNPETGEFD